MTRPTSLTRSIPGVARASAPTSNNAKGPAHLPSHRLLLFPTLPPSQPLPALVAGSDPDIVLLNEKIYNLIALAFRAYILSWLPRITRDRSLLPQIHVSLIVPILLPIFASLQSDPERLIPFVLYDLPALLARHWEVYWQARTASEQRLPYDNSDGDDSVAGSPGADLDAIYHAHLPLRSTELTITASDADGPEPDKTVVPAGQYVVSPLWLGALVDTLMRRSLPPDEYAVDVERVMMRDILARTVLGGVARRISEPAFWYALLLKFIPVRQARAKDRSRRIGVLEHVGGVLDKLVTVCFGVWAMGVWVVAAYTAAPPTTYRQTTRCWLELGREVLSVDGRMGWKNWPLRMVWAVLEITLLLLSPVLDRLIPHLIRVHLLHLGTALRLVDLLERILFPLDGYPAPTPPDPSPEETIAMRREIEERLGALIPGAVRHVIMPSHTDVEWLLSPLSHAGCNAHLVAVMYASVVGVLVPGMVVGAPAGAVQS